MIRFFNVTGAVTGLVTGLVASVLSFPLFSVADELEMTGFVAFETRLFTEQASYVEQQDYRDQWGSQISLALNPEWYRQWNGGNDVITFRPFYRIDSVDDKRQHGDIRELVWLHAQDDWELTLGIDQVFWGVSESQHLVDIINQTDAVESIDGETKLGQPMLSVKLIKDWGVVEAFVLPYFRERTFAGKDGRLRPSLAIDGGNAIYQSSNEDRHVDYALRWSHSIDILDIGLSYFTGTGRDPELAVTSGIEPGTIGSYVPYYSQIQQFGIDAQLTLETILWKLEVIHRKMDAFDAKKYSDVVLIRNANEGVAANIGFEYTLVGIFETDSDLGLLMEYQYGSEDFLLEAKDNVFFGNRWVLNNEDGTEFLFGLVQNLNQGGERSVFVEASARINHALRWRVDAWLLQADDDKQSTISAIEKDDFINVSLEYYF